MGEKNTAPEPFEHKTHNIIICRPVQCQLSYQALHTTKTTGKTLAKITLAKTTATSTTIIIITATSIPKTTIAISITTRQDITIDNIIFSQKCEWWVQASTLTHLSPGGHTDAFQGMVLLLSLSLIIHTTNSFITNLPANLNSFDESIQGF